jgi:hypothetical protein
MMRKERRSRGHGASFRPARRTNSVFSEGTDIHFPGTHAPTLDTRDTVPLATDRCERSNHMNHRGDTCAMVVLKFTFVPSLNRAPRHDYRDGTLPDDFAKQDDQQLHFFI